MRLDLFSNGVDHVRRRVLPEGRCIVVICDGSGGGGVIMV
jgi:hypothetical protein